MRQMLFFLIVSVLAVGCVKAPEPTKNIGESCMRHSECILPEGFAMQSNCPFESVCVDGKCGVVCGLKSQNIDSTTTCILDADCSCDSRGNRTIDCACLDNQCVSVEAK